MAKYTRFDPRNKKQNKKIRNKDYGSRDYESDLDKFERKSRSSDRHQLMQKLEEYYENDEDLD